MTETASGVWPVLINGQPTHCLDVADRGLQYGDGVFSTLAVHQGVPLFLNHHIERLKRDSLRLGIPFPGDRLLMDEAWSLSYSRPTSVLKIILTRGTGGRGYRCPKSGTGTRILSLHPKPEYPDDVRERGVKVRICDLRLGINPGLAGVKHLNRLEQILARAEWDDGEILEGLMLDREGFLVEGVMSNVFLVRNGGLCTPLLDRCGVTGVMRGLVMERARESGFAVDELRILPSAVAFADEVFLTNSVIGIWPIRNLGNLDFPVGELSRALTRQIDALIAEELNHP